MLRVTLHEWKEIIQFICGEMLSPDGKRLQDSSKRDPMSGKSSQACCFQLFEAVISLYLDIRIRVSARTIPRRVIARPLLIVDLNYASVR